MITEEEATRLLKRADPARADDDAPDIDALSFLSTLQARSTEVTFIDTEEFSVAPDAPRRWQFVGLAAAAAVVAVLVGALLLAGRGDPNEPQTPAATTAPASLETDPEEVAMQFLAASDARDAETVRSLVAEDATIIYTDETLSVDVLLANDEFLGWRYLEPQCEVTSPGPPSKVTCTFLMQSTVAEAYGMGPFEGSSSEFEIADGMVRRLEVDHSYDQPYTDESGNTHAEAYEAFLNWVRVTYGDPVLGYDLPEPTDPLDQRVAEWGVVAPAIRFLLARNEWDGETARLMVADDVLIEGDFAMVAADDYVISADFERALQWQFSRPTCTITDVGPPATVTCMYRMQNWLGRALDVGPYPGGIFQFEIIDGRIQRVSHQWDSSQYDVEALSVFLDWLDETHPGDRHVMFELDDNGAEVWQTTPEALALFKERVPEFVKSITGS